jgi:hypothetical protein
MVLNAISTFLQALVSKVVSGLVSIVAEIARLSQNLF